jgi:hypothetical protein
MPKNKTQAVIILSDSLLIVASESSSMVKHSPHHPKVEGSRAAAVCMAEKTHEKIVHYLCTCITLVEKLES